MALSPELLTLLSQWEGGAASCSHNKTPGQDPGAELILDRVSAQKQNGRNWVRQAA
jgi:hypothetical protein